MSRAERKAEIVRTALAVADREGFEAVSMRRIAAELGVGTMSLYTYVANKTELVYEMGEMLGSELLVPEGELSDDWREAIRQLARRSYLLATRHPWILHLLAEDPQLGPSFARHIDQSLAAVAGLDVDLRTRQLVMRAVDAYVFGCALDDSAAAADPHGAAFEAQLRALAISENLTHVQRAIEEHGAIGHMPVFELGLDWLIAGIGVSVARAR